MTKLSCIGTLASFHHPGILPDMLPMKDVQEFQAILKEEYDREFTEREVDVLAQRLLLLYESIYLKRPTEELKPTEGSLDHRTAL